MFSIKEIKNSTIFNILIKINNWVVRNCRNLLKIGILISIIKVGVFTYLHNPNFSYDESNTLNIASTSFSQIYKLLNNEHNFVGYYYILFLLKSIGPIDQVAKTFNFLTWVFSTLFFYKLSKYYINSLKLRLFAVLLFTLTPTIYFYAFYIRMYALMIFFFITHLLFLNKYLETHKDKYLHLSLIFMLVLGLVHPTTVIVATCLLIFYLTNKNNLKSKLIIIITSLSCYALVIIQLILKSNFKETYLGANSIYVNILNNFFVNQPTILLNIPQTFAFFIFIILIGGFIKSFQSNNRNIVYLNIYNALFIILIHTHSAITARHFIFFVIPVLLILTTTVNTTQNWRAYLSIALLFIFLISSIEFDKNQIVQNSKNKSFCKNMASINQERLIITDYAMLNPIIYCNRKHLSTNLVVVDYKEGIKVNIEDSSYLRFQSTRGGSANIITNRNIKILEKSPNLIKEAGVEKTLREVQKYLKTKNILEFYYITRYEFSTQNFFSTEEMEMFNKYFLVNYTYPSIFYFKEQSLNK